jgi:Na+/H+-translocating membrane pyrophosphatase
MGADLFGSYVTVLAAMVLGNIFIKIWAEIFKMLLAELDLFTTNGNCRF